MVRTVPIKKTVSTKRVRPPSLSTAAKNQLLETAYVRTWMRYYALWEKELQLDKPLEILFVQEQKDNLRNRIQVLRTRLVSVARRQALDKTARSTFYEQTVDKLYRHLAKPSKRVNTSGLVQILQSKHLTTDMPMAERERLMRQAHHKYLGKSTAPVVASANAVVVQSLVRRHAHLIPKRFLTAQ